MTKKRKLLLYQIIKKYNYNNKYLIQPNGFLIREKNFNKN